jgi:hypothetical protein
MKAELKHAGAAELTEDTWEGTTLARSRDKSGADFPVGDIAGFRTGQRQNPPTSGICLDSFGPVEKLACVATDSASLTSPVSVRA